MHGIAGSAQQYRDLVVNEETNAGFGRQPSRCHHRGADAIQTTQVGPESDVRTIAKSGQRRILSTNPHGKKG